MNLQGNINNAIHTVNAAVNLGSRMSKDSQSQQPAAPKQNVSQINFDPSKYDWTKLWEAQAIVKEQREGLMFNNTQKPELSSPEELNKLEEAAK